VAVANSIIKSQEHWYGRPTNVHQDSHLFVQFEVR